MLDLAEAARVSLSTVKRAETEDGIGVSAATADLVKAALVEAGILFVPDDGHGPGLRLMPSEDS